jgi:hypothetical protein
MDLKYDNPGYHGEASAAAEAAESLVMDLVPNHSLHGVQIVAEGTPTAGSWQLQLDLGGGWQAVGAPIYATDPRPVALSIPAKRLRVVPTDLAGVISYTVHVRSVA